MQTSGLAKPERIAPVLLLGLGNPLMGDDGAGQELLAKLSAQEPEWSSQVEFMDGGTQGLALLGKFEGRKAVIFLDAISMGDKPGAVHVLQGEELLRMGGRARTAHEGSAPQILAALELLGEKPADVVMVGLEPEKVGLGIGLTTDVTASLGLAAGFARMMVNRALQDAA